MTNKTKADWLREFADAMEADPQGWWKQYQYMFAGAWNTPGDSHVLVEHLMLGSKIRRRPRTVTRFDRNGNEVELPDLRGDFRVTIDTSEHSAAGGAKWLDYFRSLLEANDND